jgi:hypothetical protein
MIDAHAHIVEAQHGGLILSVEGDPPVPEGHPYDWHKAQPYGETFVVAPYLTADKRHADSDIIYIHCRRNGFTPDQIAAYLAGSASKVVVLDTFYKFVWKPVDFFQLLARFRDRHFLLTHGGGYDIHEMLQVLRGLLRHPGDLRLRDWPVRSRHRRQPPDPTRPRRAAYPVEGCVRLRQPRIQSGCSHRLVSRHRSRAVRPVRCELRASDIPFEGGARSGARSRCRNTPCLTSLSRLSI